MVKGPMLDELRKMIDKANRRTHYLTPMNPQKSKDAELSWKSQEIEKIIPLVFHSNELVTQMARGIGCGKE